MQVVGVTSPSTYAAIQQHRSFGYIQHLLDKKDPSVVGPIPSNLFLFFGVDQPSMHHGDHDHGYGYDNGWKHYGNQH